MQKDESQSWGNKKTKRAKFFEKTNISYSLICTRTFLLLTLNKLLAGIFLVGDINKIFVHLHFSRWLSKKFLLTLLAPKLGLRQTSMAELSAKFISR